MSQKALKHELGKRCAGKHSLDFPSKLLLLSWAQRDPEAALAWGWEFNLSQESRGDSFWGDCLDIICSEWIASNPATAASWLIAHYLQDEEKDLPDSPPAPYFHSERFRASWFDRAPVDDFLKVYHALGEQNFRSPGTFVANLDRSGDLEVIFSSWDQVPAETVARLDREIAARQGTLDSLEIDTAKHLEARHRLSWARESRAKALGKTKNPSGRTGTGFQELV